MMISRIVAGVLISAALLSSCRSEEKAAEAPDLKKEKAAFTTHLTKEEHGRLPLGPVKDHSFEIIHYPSPAGSLAAYITPKPADGKKHPILIWLVGGFDNSLSAEVGEKAPPDNDQYATAYREAGMPLMFPTLRGGNDNPGSRECLYGEVDDVLAAAEYAAKLDWVDPKQIYLGGHSSGGGLALLAAESAPLGQFVQVIAFGPVARVERVKRFELPFDLKNEKECRLRSPVWFLSSIKCPTLIVEGDGGDTPNFKDLQEQNRNPNLTFTLVPGYSHFSILAPANAVLAKKLTSAYGTAPLLTLTSGEVKAASESIFRTGYLNGGEMRMDHFDGDVVFYQASGAADDLQALRGILEKALPGIHVLSSEEETVDPPYVCFSEEQSSLKDLALPTPERLKFMTGGLEPKDVDGINHCTKALEVNLFANAADVETLGKKFNAAVGEYAMAKGAYVMDRTTRNFFTPAGWNRVRVAGWPGKGMPDLHTQIQVHRYTIEKGKPNTRLATLGMEKFALPDLVIPECEPAGFNQAHNVLMAACQALVEHPVVESTRAFPVDISALRSGAAARDERSVLHVSLVWPVKEDNESDNPQVAIDFEGAEGTTYIERLASALAKIKGAAAVPAGK